jgi:hypothetical protein
LGYEGFALLAMVGQFTQSIWAKLKDYGK